MNEEPPGASDGTNGPPEGPAAAPAGWTSDLSVGLDAIDEDHKAFFHLAEMLTDKDEGNGVTESALLILDEYILGHFLREEKAMKASGYPDLPGHVLKHNQFKARVRAIAQAWSEGAKSAADDLGPLVLHWLRSHIQKEDQKYKGWVRKEKLDSRPLVYLAMEAEAGDTHVRY